jgi:hypothetical protein
MVGGSALISCDLALTLLLYERTQYAILVSTSVHRATGSNDGVPLPHARTWYASTAAVK